MFLERLTQMLNSGEVSASPIFMEMFPLSPDGPPLPWPEELDDLQGLITNEQDNGMIASSLRSSVWLYVDLLKSGFCWLNLSFTGVL